MRYNYFLAALFVLMMGVSFSACKKGKRFEVDSKVKKDQQKVSIIRFDSALITLDTVNLKDGLKKLSANYPDIYTNYFDKLLDIEPEDITELLSDTLFSKVNADVLNTFKDVTSIENKMTIVYAYFSQYFPEVELPGLYVFISGCNRSVFAHPGYIGIGVDLYLGRDYPFYKELAYEYLIQNMDPESIPVDITSTILTSVFPQRSQKERLLEKILYQGKILYMLSVMLPNEKEENIIGYSKEQLSWSKKFEREIWGAMIDQKDVFSSDMLLIRKYTGDAPFTQPISQDSPGRLGSWIGWQIVKSYMANNHDVGLRELALDNDFQTMLEQSKYKP